MGVGAGIYLYVGPIYISEVTPKNIRGSFVAAASCTLTLGFSLVYYIGNNMSWRTLALVGATPSFIQVLGVFFIPESPRWLSKIGLEKEVEASLQRLRGENADISTEAAEIKDFTETVQRHSGSTFMDLFSRKYARPLIVSFTYNPELEHFKSLDGWNTLRVWMICLKLLPIFNIIRLESG
uniref:Sugar transporter n=1 Tax=Solanum tuberosum TaxID=4113 RepID=M1CS65_SOLTU